jgi:hypothetical protein
MDTREVKISEVRGLVGSLLTVTEAICQDKNQREAAKILVKQTVFRWFSQDKEEFK